VLNLKEINLYVISMPLKTPFQTHLQTVEERKSIIIEVVDKDGQKGYGEAVAFSSPWYTEETVETVLHMLSDFLIPLVLHSELSHPDFVSDLFKPLRRNNMAKASIETALWDLYAKQNGEPLADVLGGVRRKIPAGAVVAANSITAALQQMEMYLEAGYQRIKLKINPADDYVFLKEIRRHFPTAPIMADANSGYTLKDIGKLQALDEFNLLMIEQPLGVDDIFEHSKLQKQLNTPVCLDESIHSIEEVKTSIELGSCRVINIKIGRVGGLKPAMDIYRVCQEHNIEVWVGGMLEFGVSRAFNIAFASLPNFHIPGDISATSRYWQEDITTPEVIVEQGFINVPTTPGIGFHINEKRLNEVTLFQKSFNKNTCALISPNKHKTHRQ
jgi:o-succinylbenzoate synthase